MGSQGIPPQSEQVPTIEEKDMKKLLSTIQKIHLITVFVVVVIYVTTLTNAKLAHAGYSFLFSIPDGQVHLDSAGDVAIDKDGNIYVSVAGDVGKIVKLNSEGVELARFGIKGAGDGQFRSGVSLELDRTGNIYVIDRGNNRIQKFDSNGNFLFKFGTKGIGDGQFDFPLGIVLDSIGNIYVADFKNNRIQKFDANGNFLFKFGTEGEADGEFNSPRDIALDTAGNIYVTDYGNNRVQKFDSKGNFLFKLGTEGRDNGEFIAPQGVIVDNAGNIYVSDDFRVQKFDSNGNFLSILEPEDLVKVDNDGNILSTEDIINSRKSGQAGMAFDSTGNIYVADFKNDRIRKFDPDGSFLTKFGTKGLEDGNFDLPSAVALDKAGNIYVTETNNHRVQKFDSKGNFLLKFGTVGKEDGQFLGPSGVAVDSAGNIYVTDGAGVDHDDFGFNSGNHRVQKFDTNGNFLMTFGSMGSGDGEFFYPNGIVLDDAENIYVIDGKSRVQKFDTKGDFLSTFGTRGSGDGQFGDLLGITVDGTGNIYVTDFLFIDFFTPHKNRVQKFDPKGNFLFKFGSPGSKDGDFSSPHGIMLDRAENIYVADSGNNRIQKFDPNGKFLSKFGMPGNSAGSFLGPVGITLDREGNIYVADSGNHRIQVFKPEVDTDNDFSDVETDGITSGTIIDSGDQTLTITDEPNPIGVRIAAAGSDGTRHALLSACGSDTEITLDAGDEIVVTCGSTDVDVISGTVETLFRLANEFIVTSTLKQGNGITFDPDTFSIMASSHNPDMIPVAVVSNGRKSSININPGQTIELLVNNLVTQSETLETSLDTEPGDGGIIGTFTITSTFTNISSESIKFPLFVVRELSGGNILLNADGNAGNAGATLTPDVVDGVFVPGESMTVNFVIGLQDIEKFTFVVDLLGVAE